MAVMVRKKRSAAEEMLFEYEVTLTKILPRSYRRGDDAIVDEISHLLSCRDWLEEHVCQRGDGKKNASLCQSVAKLDQMLIAQRARLLKAYPEYASERERLRKPKSAWWWYLDQIKSDTSAMWAKPKKKSS